MGRALAIVVILLASVAYYAITLTEKNAELTVANETAIKAIDGWKDKHAEQVLYNALQDRLSQERTEELLQINKDNQKLSKKLKDLANAKPENKAYFESTVPDDIWLQLKANNSARRNRIQTAP